MWMTTLGMAISLMAPLPKLSVEGQNLVDPSGKRVVLRGCNLGNWLVIEPWMLDQPDSGIEDQYALEETLKSRFGDAERQRLMDLWREHWITERDFEMIRTFRFNLIRLPMNYRQFEDDAKPYSLRGDAWKWTDRAVDWAEKHGIYVILDMHGTQGGQSVYDHTGRSGQNKLWSEPENSKRLAWLWGEIAKRYRNRNAVVAYDVFNEPYGGQPAEINRVFTQALESIRKHDPDKLVFAHGRWDTFDFYGDPKERGWKNAGFQMHYYPGLFGFGRPNLITHQRHLENLKPVVEKVRTLNVPFLVGEMNVVFQGQHLGAEMMRRTYDFHEAAGWMTTMWSYKVLNRDANGHRDGSWGMVSNAEKPPRLNFKTATKEEIERYFRWQSTVPYVVYEELRAALAPENANLPELPAMPEPRRTAPQGELAGWQQSDIGNALKGGFEATEGGFNLYGGGDDIWSERDQFRFLYQAVEGDFELSVRVDRLEEMDDYSKAGLMVRADLNDTSEHVMLSTFTDGELQCAFRTAKGKTTESVPTVGARFPIRMRMTRRGTVVTTEFLSPQGPVKVGEVNAQWLPNRVYAGVVALSHDNSRLVQAQYGELTLRRLTEE